MYEMMSVVEINSLDAGSVIVDASGYHYKLHSDNEWRHCNKFGIDKDNKNPISTAHFRFPVSCYSHNDYSIEERLFLLELRVEGLENNDSINS